jgi:hypothetical protein
MVVLTTGYELYVVDHAGLRWSQEMQARPEASTESTSGGQRMPFFDGAAVSNNQEFVAYVDHAREIVIRSIADGTEIGRVPYQAEGETQLRCVSSDGDFVALASVPLDLPKGTTGDRLPWRVTIVDMRTGQATIERPLEDLVKERTAGGSKMQFALYLLDWLPGHKLLANYAGWEWETYSYDLDTKVMEKIPGIGWVDSVSDSGLVYGSGTEQQGGKPLVWDGRTTETLELEPSWDYVGGGAFNLGGDALAVQVTSAQYKPLGWQVYRDNQGRWERSGGIAENSWMKAAPRMLSSDGTLAYTALEGGLKWESGQSAALLSYDFQTGVWQEWLGPHDLLAHFGQFPFVAIIPTASPAEHQ